MPMYPDQFTALPLTATDVLDDHDGSVREALYAEFQPLVRRLIRQYGDTSEVRKDLAVEIDCRFAALLDAFDPARGVPLRPFLVRQLSAAAYVHSRSIRRMRTREAHQERSGGGKERTITEGRTTSRHEQIARNGPLMSLPEAVSRLPRRQRQAFVLRYYDDSGLEEIGKLVHVGLAATESLLRNAITNVRRRLI